MQQSRTHPARYSMELIPPIVELLAGCKNIIDPFGGTGERLAMIAERLMCSATGIEIQPQFIVRSDIVRLGDATRLIFSNETFDGSVSSPTYGNRMNDRYLGNGQWDYINYTACAGEYLHENNTGSLKFHTLRYKQLHISAWTELYRVLIPGSPFILNIKDSWQGKGIVPVSQWHYDTLVQIGFKPEKVLRVSVPGMRMGANNDKRIGKENLILFRK